MSSPAAEFCCDPHQSGGNGILPGKTSCTATNSTEKKARTRILFVDDEPSMVRVLKMGMRSMANEWDMQFAEGGEAGLALVEKETFDVVVSDMRMAGVNGAQLLNHVLRRNPQTVRIILSGYA